MIKFRRACFVAVAFLGAVSHSHAQAVEDPNVGASQPPLLIYSFTGIPSPTGNAGFGWLGGAIADGLVALGERPSKPLLEELNKTLNQEDRQRRLEEAFKCVFVEAKSSACPEVVFLTVDPFAQPGRPAGLPSDELTSILKEHRGERVWVLKLTEQFHVAGYYLSALAAQAYIDGAGKEHYRRLTAMYADTYTQRLDALSRGLPIDTTSADPRFGSKEARAAYWLNGSPRRLDTAVATAPTALAELLSAMKDLPWDAKLVSSSEDFKKLPKLGDLRKEGKASCSRTWCGMRVRRDLGDRLHLEAGWRGTPRLVSAPRWGL